MPDALGQAWDDGKTLDVDLEEVQNEQFRPISSPLNERPLTPTQAPDLSFREMKQTPASAYDLAAALELPIEMGDSASPFDGIAPVNLPTGLERTGIIPIGDFDVDEFAPPPLDDEKSKASNGLVGLTDIPESATQVALRSSDVQASTNQAEATTASTPQSAREEPESLDSADLEEIQPDLVIEEPENELEATPALNQQVSPLNIQPAKTKSERPLNRHQESKPIEKEETTEDGDAQELVRALRKGETLSSSERIQVFLAMTRLLLDQGIITEEQLATYLLDLESN